MTSTMSRVTVKTVQIKMIQRSARWAERGSAIDEVKKREVLGRGGWKVRGQCGFPLPATPFLDTKNSLKKKKKNWHFFQNIPQRKGKRRGIDGPYDWGESSQMHSSVAVLSQSGSKTELCCSHKFTPRPHTTIQGGSDFSQDQEPF